MMGLLSPQIAGIGCDIILVMGLLDFETPQEEQKRKAEEEIESKKAFQRLYIIGGTVLFVIIAVFIFGLYAKFLNPELGERWGLGKSLFQVMTTKRISSCVILDERYCDRLVFQSNVSDNARLPGVGVKVPIGASVYAPFDGIVYSSAFFADGEMSRRAIVIYRSDDIPSDPDTVMGTWFIASRWSENKLSGDKVKKGDLIAKIDEEIGLFQEMIGENENNLIVFPSDSWHTTSGKDIENPPDYFKAFIKHVEKEPL